MCNCTYLVGENTPAATEPVALTAAQVPMYQKPVATPVTALTAWTEVEIISRLASWKPLEINVR